MPVAVAHGPLKCCYERAGVDADVVPAEEEELQHCPRAPAPVRAATTLRL